MKEKIFIGVAWPYANGSLHLGHMAGCYLPADIFARFNRMNGNDVLMVSGSDEHGTPITITAEKENTTAQNIVDRYNKEHKENMKQFNISFDLFTRTTTDNHEKVVQNIFKTLFDKGYIYKKSIEALYCNNCNRFLPDRYIEGTCPNCRNEKARGDQCDECGNMLDPKDLIKVKCKICGKIPEFKTSVHLFFALSAFEKKLLNWIKEKEHWKSSVLKFTKNWIKDGLQDRAITRDIKWGIKVPINGFEDKRIYVWFDAVIGYLAASMEWSKKNNDENKWIEWWKNKNAKHYYFLAKDNIPFHTLIWPSILMGYDIKLNLPYNIPANEYLRIKGEQFSKSKGLGVWVPEIVEKFSVDSIRYYLSINMPENKDSNWSWEDFITKNNDELVGTYGNFIHRVFTFAYKNFGKIPSYQKQDDLDKEAIRKIEQIQKKVKESIANCNFKKGLREVMNLAQFGNYYFDQKQPWKLIKSDKLMCGSVLNICFRIIQALAIFMAPYLPSSSNEIWRLLGNKDSIYNYYWDDSLLDLKINTQLEKPKPLFEKLTLKEIMQEEDPFSKLDLRVGKVIDIKDHPNADKLFILNVNLGDIGKRILVAGIRSHYTKKEIIGKNIVIVTNLKPATIRGIESKGMLLAATDKYNTISLLNPGDVKPGSEIFIEGIARNPISVLDFEDFKKINMIVDQEQRIKYQGKTLFSEKGPVKTDKIVEKGANVS
jgi:methionyl-tRNA synthetase